MGKIEKEIGDIFSDIKMKKEDRAFPLQVRIRKDLFDAAKLQMKRDGLKWRDLVEQMLQVYISQRKK